MASTIAAITTSGGGVVTTADASGILNLVSGTTTIATVASTGLSTPATINVPNTFGFKNRIINGSMFLDQRNAGASVSATVTAAQTYTLDRWAYLASQTAKFTVQQTPSATETGYAVRVAAGFAQYLAVTSSSAYSVAAGDYFSINQPIEGGNVADLAWGTTSAKTITLSFWVYSSLTGTFAGSLRNSANNRSYPFTYTVSSASTWEQKSITIAGDQSGTWLTTVGSGIQVVFSLGSGSTYNGTAGSWAAGNYISVTGAVSVVGTSGATFYVTGVQFETGSTTTSFDYRPYGTELVLCQRYYEKTFDITTAPAQNITYNGSVGICPGGAGAASVGLAISWKFAVTKRASPTMTSFSVSAANSNWYAPAGPDSSVTAGFTSTATSGSVVYGTSASQTDRLYYIQATASSEL